MRRLEQVPLGEKVRLPQSTHIVGVIETSGARVLLIEYDARDIRPFVERRFRVITVGSDIPGGAAFVTQVGAPVMGAVYELQRHEVPDNLDPKRHEDYRLLLREGYTYRTDPAPGWVAPDDVPAGSMSLDAMEAVGRLQEHGYGPVVS